MATTKIHRTFGTPTDLNKWTYSAWIKLGPVSTLGYLFECTTGASNFTAIKIDSTARLFFGNYNSGYLGQRDLSRLLRDPAAWYHIVAVWDSDNATPADRMKLYINGVQQTIYHGTTNPTSGEACQMASGADCWIGVHQSTNDYFSGEMSWVQFVDGSALAPTEFGEVDSTSGIWKIKTDVYGTPGNNGFCLKMEDRTNLDLDSSSNAHTFTTTGNLTATSDNPSNNFCLPNGNNGIWAGLNYANFSNGNTTVNFDSANEGFLDSTMGVAASKWYWEVEQVSTSGSTVSIIGQAGICGTQPHATGGATGPVTKNTDGYVLVLQTGDLKDYSGETVAWTDDFTNGDVLMIAADLDNSKLYFGKNGTWLNSGDPTSGATGTGAAFTIQAVPNSGYYFPVFGKESSGSYQWVMNTNFGNGYLGTTSLGTSNQDADSIGYFKYSVPAGYYALCTKNIKAYGG
jgi:hypothetical protein